MVYGMKGGETEAGGTGGGMGEYRNALASHAI